MNEQNLQAEILEQYATFFSMLFLFKKIVIIYVFLFIPSKKTFTERIFPKIIVSLPRISL